MSPEWWLVLLVGATTASMKSFGPVVFGGRELPAWLRRFTDMVPAAVLAALIAVQTATSGQAVTLDARVAGVLAAASLLAWRRPLWMAMAGAVLVTAGVRWALGGV